jgi:putative inorganic carbon (HCO3(-)) transporter
VITAEAGARRLKSVFGTPNNAALYFGRLVPIGAAVAVLGEGQRRWAYGAAAALMAVALGLTLSKGAILLALPAGLGMVLVLWLGRAGLIAVGAGIAAEALALIPLSQHPRFSGLVDFTSATSTSRFRLQLWQSTLRLLRDHPITGVGLDQFLYAYRGRYILPAAWRQPDLSQPHNFLLNYWVRMGLVGLAAGVWMQVAFWRLAWRTQNALRGVDRGGRALAVGLMGGMAAMVAHGMVDAVHFVIDLAFIFSMSLGLMAQLGEEAAQNGRDDDRRADAAAGRG